MLPPLSVLPGLIIPAFALAFVGLVQGASITQSVPNPDGKYPDASRDFIGQGAANLIAGLLQGMPVGGSMSATALVRSAGARSRLANMIAGVTMALAILLFGRLVGMLAMPALAGLLIVVGFRTLKLDQVKMVWKTGLVQQVVMVITFVAALFVPLQYAVLIGVGMAVLLFVFQQSNKITVMAWKIEPGRYPIESAPPASGSGAARHGAGALWQPVLCRSASVRGAAPGSDRRVAPRGCDPCAARKAGCGQHTAGSAHPLCRRAAPAREQVDAGRRRSKRQGADGKNRVLHQIGHENVFLVQAGVGQALQDAVDDAEKWIVTKPRQRSAG